MEIWKTITSYPDYQVSNFGNVKSLKFNKEIILNPSLFDNGYLFVGLYKNGFMKLKSVHQLVALEFLNHDINSKLVVNHKDFNRTNNNITNLECISIRENSNKKHIKSTSDFVGVGWYSKLNKWRSRIRINGKLKHIGYFKKEIDASDAYQKELEKLRAILNK